MLGILSRELFIFHLRDYFDGIVMTLVKTDQGNTIDQTYEMCFQLQTNVARFFDNESHNSFRKVSYKLQATLRRKKDVPRMSDNNIWTDAICQKRPTKSSSSSTSIWTI
jgi:hypothetical protein